MLWFKALTALAQKIVGTIIYSVLLMRGKPLLVWVNYWETWKCTDLRNNDSAALLHVHVYSHNALNPNNNISLVHDMTQMIDKWKYNFFTMAQRKEKENYVMV